MSKHYSQKDNLITIMTEIAKKTPKGIMNGDTTVGHITWQMYLMRDYLKLDGTPLANASTGYAQLLEFAQNNNLITADTTDNSLFKYNSNTDVLTLPNYIDLCLQGGNSVEEKDAGLPNIEGTIPAFLTGYADQSDGALSTTTLDNAGSPSTGSANRWSYLSLDASDSNSIYGNSNTVQPPAITLIPQIKYRKATTMYEQIDAVVNYSTTEKVVGTWIDGKPLYQKTFSITSPSSAGWGSVQDLSSLNISNCIHQYGFCIYSSTEWIDIPYNNGTTICQCAINLSSGGLKLYITSDCISKPCYITIQYTKTTD